VVSVCKSNRLVHSFLGEKRIELADQLRIILGQIIFFERIGL